MKSRNFAELKRTYIAELREAKKIADAWWQSLVSSQLAENIEASVAELKRRWPDGPASHPRVIAVVVMCMHACDALNQGRERNEQEPIGQFLMHSIDTDDSQDLVDFTDALSYWPIGRDGSGRAV